MIAEKYGWSYRYVLHGVAWVNIRMMLADAPGYVSDKAEDGTATEATADDLKNLANTL